MPKSQRIALHGEKWTESEEIPIKRSGIGPHGDVIATATRDSGLQRNVALPFGVVLALVGVIGFAGIPVTDGEIPGLFGISPLHNAVHLLTGVAGLAVGFAAGGAYSRDYNEYLGLVYLLVFVVGVVVLAADVTFVVDRFGLNRADNVLHLVLGIVLAAVDLGSSSAPTGAAAN